MSDYLSQKKYFFLIILVIITRILDGYTTYLSSPDLKLERNIIIKNLNLGWTPVIILGFLLIIFIIILISYTYKNQNYFTIETKSFKKYINVFFYRQNLTFKETFYKLPALKPIIIFLGILFPISLIYYSIFLIINNYFMYLTDSSDFLYNILIYIHDIIDIANVIIIISILIFTSFTLLKKGYNSSKIKQ